MIKEKIESYFNRFPTLRVLFFFDEHKDFEEEVKALDLADIHIEFWENNPFILKCKLTQDLKSEKVLLYLPIKQPNTQDAFQEFPLMGLWLANKELQLDHVGAFMEDFHLQRHQKSLVSKYMGALKYAGVQEVCAPILSASHFEEPKLQRGLVSAFLKFKAIESWSILVAKLLTLSTDKKPTELDKVVKKITELNFEDVVIKRIYEVTGFSIQSITQASLLDVARSILYNSLMQTITEKKTDDPYSKFKIDDTTQLTRLNQMLQEVDRNPTLKPKFETLLELVSNDIKGSKLIEVYGDDANFAEYNTEMIWDIVSQVQSHLVSAPSDIIKRLETLSLQPNVGATVKQALKYLIQVAKMHDYIGSIKTYILDTPEAYVHHYTDRLYKIDSNYRRAILSYKSLDSSDIPQHIAMEAIHSELNTSYDRHTDLLNREWLKCLNQFKFDYANLNLPKQYNFYATEIAPADQKVVVVISDALRYEAGYELLSEMHGDTKNTAEMRYMLASIPSKTNIGMAQLLPGNEKLFNDGDIKIDGVSSASTYRSKILEMFNPNSKAIQYGTLDGLGRPEIREIFKNDVVYVYHDVIDATGDTRASERRTFDAVEDAVFELKKFVKLLHASYNVAKVFVTADHGFLYHDKKIEEKDQEKLPNATMMQSHNRYFVTSESSDKELSYSIPLSATTQFKDDVFVTIPFSVNRYNKGGVGHQFVHGGGSLQELVIPVIESSRKREDVTQKVNPILINKGGYRVVSNILKLNILQENEVSRVEKERNIKVGLYKESQLVSNEEELLLNFTSESPSERLFRVELILSAEAAREPFLKLKLFDTDDKLNPIIEERVQNMTIIPTDF
ncbi:BREX-1 system phosphatase PglZ type A [Mariniflexile ostreae]|uniref:BREX-1 system phosphatase PglZ type A n=1 Tax=Mariniflexile ostreae TaxID=1520892 RepID=A0ABV5FAQ7_9FLAO